ncbi:MAG: NAD(P)/FAD-dependent oxidoreductase [Gammaproteobacteria bacterium]
MNSLSRRQVLIGLGAASLPSPRLRAAARQWDVVIIGAGLSGLRTALEIEAQGLSVKVLEARNRVGGRLYTFDDVPGAPEAGGNVIGGFYARVQDTVTRFGLKLEPIRPREPVEYDQTRLGDRVAFHLNGKYVTTGDWPDDRTNPFPTRLRAKMPWSFTLAALAPDNPLKNMDDWLLPAARRYDEPLADTLKRAGISDAAIKLGVGENQVYGRSPTEVSTLHLYQLLTWATHQNPGKQLWHIVGGNQRMPEAMAAALKEPVKLDCAVSAIHDRGKSVAVETTDGVFEARRIVVTLPAPALRRIRMTPEPPAAQRRGIDTLAYGTVTQVLFRVDDAYWEQDGLPPTLWTDTDIGQLLAYPYGPGGATESAAVWLSGADAIEADKLSSEALVKRSMAVLKHIRPKAAKALKPLKVFSWQKERYTGGTWASWAPGQISAFANEIGQRHGRIHFAGEHTARLERGMEGAMESADRVVQEILERTL